jgi:hypothetical protein
MFEINAFIKDDEQLIPFHLQISEPLKSDNSDDYSCRVHIPFFFNKDKNIFGINEEQARKLSVNFVAFFLKDKILIDKNGQPINLQELNWVTS